MHASWWTLSLLLSWLTGPEFPVTNGSAGGAETGEEEADTGAGIDPDG